MEFHIINFIYLGIWWFVALSYIIGYMTDDYCPFYEGAKKVNLRKFYRLFAFNKKFKEEMWVVSFFIELGSLLLLLLSIVFVIISGFGDSEYAIFFLSIYSLISFIYFLISGIIMAIYRGR